MMSDASSPLRLEVVSVLRNGRRRYAAGSKQRLVEACLKSGVSLAGVALRHGVNANLLRKWVTEHRRGQGTGAAVGAIERATEPFVPVVELRGVAGPAELPAPLPTERHAALTKAARRTDPPAARLTAEMPNGITLRLECSGHDVELVSAMIVSLGRCDVPVGG